MTTDTRTLLPMSAFTNWLALGERGMSSQAIVEHLTGVRLDRWSHGNHPYDPDDFRRCQLLLNAVPLARLMFPTMRECSPKWARLVDAWDEIHLAIQEEAPDYLGSPGGKSAPRAHKLMQRVLAGGTACAPCDGSGKAEACPKCKGSGRRAGGRCRADGCAGGRRYCRVCRGRGFTGGAS